MKPANRNSLKNNHSTMTKEQAKEIVGMIFGHDTANDDDIVHWYWEVNRTAMEEYAKQQAIAFFKFCLPGPTDFEPHISARYEQFIEQQTKDI